MKKTQPSSSSKITATSDWLKPISTDEPCGPNLEYDSEYAVLCAKLIPKGEAQYGNFIGTPEMPNWSEIERDCQRMLLRTKDIAIIIFLLRCRVRLHQAIGLKEGLTVLVESLETFTEHIHPQLVIDGELDKTVRANALAVLTDPEGLLADIREIVLSKSTAMRLQIRDIERAFATPRPADALAPDSVKRQLRDLRQSGDKGLEALIDSVALIKRLISWVDTSLTEDAPDLDPLVRLLSLFDKQEITPKENQNNIEKSATTDKEQAPIDSNIMENSHNLIKEAAVENESLEKTHPQVLSPIEGRTYAIEQIRELREWFEQHEPSSPVSLLLKQAERLIGKSFIEITQSIPIELLKQWEQDLEA